VSRVLHPGNVRNNYRLKPVPVSYACSSLLFLSESCRTNIGVLQNYSRISRENNRAYYKKLESWIYRVPLNRNRLNNYFCYVNYYSVDPNTFQCKLISRNGKSRFWESFLAPFSELGVTAVGVEIRRIFW